MGYGSSAIYYDFFLSALHDWRWDIGGKKTMEMNLLFSLAINRKFVYA
jgi:hypothetical protein